MGRRERDKPIKKSRPTAGKTRKGKSVAKESKAVAVKKIKSSEKLNHTSKAASTTETAPIGKNSGEAKHPGKNLPVGGVDHATVKAEARVEEKAMAKSAGAVAAAVQAAKPVVNTPQLRVQESIVQKSTVQAIAAAKSPAPEAAMPQRPEAAGVVKAVAVPVVNAPNEKPPTVQVPIPVSAAEPIHVIQMPPIPESAKPEPTAGRPLTPLSEFGEPTAVAPTAPPAYAPVPPILFEVAWEVCWQLGGIYTVLRSKAATMQQRWGDNYCLIGPYNPATAAMEFEERASDGVIREVLDGLRNMGIACHYGRWLIPGRPRVILLDYRSRFSALQNDKYLMWKDHGITCPASDGEVNEVVAFGFTVTEFFRELASKMTDRPILAHFHEWMGGVAVPRIAHLKLPVTTVFTTHATLLGRYLAGDNPYFYQHLPFLNGDEQAAKYQILAKHQIEKAAAHASTVFTTVSEVTAREATQLLGRKADCILPNGLNIQKFAALHEFQNLHRQYKECINEFVMGHFFPSYTFDLDKTLYFFTSGRYEYRNKGLDMYIEALHRLNQRLRIMPDPPTIVAFIITRAPTRNINVATLQSQAMFDELRSICRDVERTMGKRLFHSATSGRFPTIGELLPDEAQVRLKRAMHVWRSARQPGIVTHDLQDDAGDAVLRHLRHRRLFNAADDPVKMVFHPEFLSATTPPLNLDYDNFVRGCHLGIFTSYYEPWGYTPMESIALGVPAVTTDLSGFGAYVERNVPQHEEQGVLVLNRSSKSFEDSVEDLVNYLMGFVRLNRRQRIEQRNRVERLGEVFDWSVLIRHYHEAHDLAMERTHGVRPGKFEIRVV